MADDLTFELDLDTDDFERGLEATSKGLDKNTRQTQQFEKELLSIIKSFARLGKDLKKVNNNFGANAKTVVNTANAYNEATVAITAATDAVNEINDAFSGVIDTFSKIINTTFSLVSVFQQLTDPAFLLKLSKLATILSLFLKLKGFGVLSDKIKLVSKSLEDGAVFFKNFEESGKFSLNSLAERAAFLDRVLIALSDVSAVLGGTIAIGVISGLSQVLKEFGLVTVSVGDILVKVPKMVDDILDRLGGFIGLFKNVGIALNNTSKSFLRLLTSSGKTTEEILKDLPSLTKAFDKSLQSFADTLEALGKNLPDAFDTILMQARTLGGNLGRNLKEGIIEASGAFKEAFKALRMGWKKEAGSLVRFTSETGPVIVVSLSDRFRHAMEEFSRTTIGTAFKQAGNAMASSSKGLAASLGDTISSEFRSLGRIAEDLSDAFVTPVLEQFSEIIKGTVKFGARLSKEIAGSLARTLSFIPTFVRGLAFSFGSLGEIFFDTGDDIERLSRTFKASISLIKSSLPTNIFKDFGAAAKSSLNVFRSIFTGLPGDTAAIASEVGKSLSFISGELKVLGNSLKIVLGAIGADVATLFSNGFLKNLPIAVAKMTMGLKHTFTLLAHFLLIGAKDLAIVAARIPLLLTDAFAKVSAQGLVNTLSKIPSIVGGALQQTARGVRAFAEGFQTGVNVPMQVATSIVSKFGKVVNSVPVPSLVALTEVSSLAGPPLLAIGAAATKSESALVRFTGFGLIAAAIAMTTLSTAMLFFLDVIGRFIGRIGGALLDSMRKFEEVAQKAQVTTKAFEFTIVNFGKAVGTDAVGSLDLWNAKIAELVDTTQFAQGEIQKSVQLLVGEGQAIGLTLNQSFALLNRSVDLASAKQRDLSDVINSVVNGLTGTTQAVVSLGINLKESALEHTKYAETIHSLGEELNETNIQQARFSAVMEQSAPLAGFAAEQVKTIAGANAQLDKTLQTVQATLGEQSTVTVAYTNALTNLAKAFLDLPKGVLDAVGASMDFLGVSLQILGFILQYSLLISGLATLYALLNKSLLASTMLQAKFGAAAAWAARSVGAQAIAVTGLNSVLINMMIILKGGLITALKAMGVAILGVAKAVLVFTARLLINPLFLGGVAIVASIAAVIVALKELNTEFTEILGAQEDLIESTEDTMNVFDDLATFIKDAFGVMIKLAKLAIVGWLKLAKFIRILTQGYEKLWAMISGGPEAVDKVNLAISESLDELDALDQVATNTFVSLVSGLEDTALAAGAAGNSVKDFTDQLDSGKIRGFSESLKGLADFELKDLATSVLGDAADKALLAFTSASAALGSARNTGVVDDNGKRRKATLKEIHALEMAFETRKLEAIKLRKDEITNLGKLNKDLAVQGLGELEAVKEAGRIKLADFKQRIEMQQKLGDFTKEEIRLIGQVEAGIKAVTQAEVARVVAAQREKEIQELEKKAKILEEIQKEVANLNVANLSALGRGVEAAEAEHAIKLAQLDTLRATIAANKDLSQIQKDAANAVVDMAELTAAEELQLKIDKESFINQFNEIVDAIPTFNLGGDIAKGVLQAFGTVAEITRTIVRGFDTLVSVSGVVVDTFMGLVSGEGLTGFFDSVSALASGDLDKAGAAFGKVFANADSAMSAFNPGGDEGGDQCEAENQCREKGNAEEDKRNGKQNALADKRAKAQKAAGQFMDAAIKGLTKTLAFTFVKLGDLAGAMFSPETINNLADQLGNLDKLPQALLKAFDKLLQNMDKIIDKFAEAMDKFIDKLPSIVSKILDKLPELFDKMFDALESILDKLPQIFARIFDKLPDLLAGILKRLPEIIRKLFSAIGQIIGSLIKALPDIFKELMFALPDIVEAVLEGVIAAIGTIVAAVIDDALSGGFEKFLGAILRAVVRLVIGIVRGIVKGLQRALSSIFNGEVINSDAFKEAGAKISDGFKAGFEKVTGEAGKLFKVLDFADPAKALDPAQALKDLADDVSQTFVISIGLFNNIIKAWRKLWGWVIGWFSKLGKLVKMAWEGVMRFFGDLGHAIEAIFRPILDFFGKVFGTIISEVWNPIIQFFQEDFFAVINDAWLAVLDVFKNLWATVSNAWSSIINFFKNIFGGKISGAFSGVVNFFNDTFGTKISEAFTSAIDGIKDKFSGFGKSIFDGLSAALGKSSIFADAGKKIFDKLKTSLDGIGTLFSGFGSKIFNGLKDMLNDGVNGLGAIFTKIFNTLNPGNLLEKVFKIDAGIGKKGDIENILGVDVPFAKFAAGGRIPGLPKVAGDSPKNDTFPAMLSPGEFIIPRSIAQDPDVSKLLTALLNGKLPGFFNAGPVGTFVEETGGKVTGGGKKLIGDITSSAKEAGKQASAAYKAGLNRGQLVTKILSDPKGALMTEMRGALTEMMSFNANALKAQTGGLVGGFGSGDSTRALLQPGEFVVNRNGVKSLGLGILGAANQGGLGGGNGSTTFNIELEVNTTQPVDEKFIRGRLLPAVKKEFKESSLRGDFIMSKRGLR